MSPTDLLRQHHAIQVTFYPGGWPFFSAPPDELRKAHVTPLMDATGVTRTVRGEPMPHVRQTRVPSVEGDEPCEPETTLATTAGTPDIQERQ